MPAAPSGGSGAPSLSSKARVLAVADAEHRAKPAANIRIADIAKGAGVSPALVIVHFKSKNDLLFAAYLAWLSDSVLPKVLAHAETMPAADVVDLLLVKWRATAPEFHRVRDLVSASFWWTEAETAAFTLTMAPMTTLLDNALKRHNPFADETARARALYGLQAGFDHAVRRFGATPQNFDDVGAALRASAAAALHLMGDEPS